MERYLGPQALHRPGSVTSLALAGSQAPGRTFHEETRGLWLSDLPGRKKAGLCGRRAGSSVPVSTPMCHCVCVLVLGSTLLQTGHLRPPHAHHRMLSVGQESRKGSAGRVLCSGRHRLRSRRWLRYPHIRRIWLLAEFVCLHLWDGGPWLPCGCQPETAQLQKADFFNIVASASEEPPNLLEPNFV